MPPRPIRIATRNSAQAARQAAVVAATLAERTGCASEFVYISTSGDQQANVPLHTIGGQGVFVKEIQRAVLDGRADIAVHSAKDLPTELVPGLHIGAFCERRDPTDALVGLSLQQLDHGATVATGSVRRRAQLHEHRPDLHFEELRGNIATRLDRIPTRGSIVMAVAALQILQMTHRIAEALDPTVFVPAVGQGSVAVEHRANDDDNAALVAALDHSATRRAVEIERAFMGELGSGCSLPVGAYADGAMLHTFLAAESGDVVDRRSVVLSGREHDVDAARAAANDAFHAVGGRR